MKGRRTAAMLSVVLGHALVVFMLLALTRPKAQRSQVADELFVTTLIPVFQTYDDRIADLPEPRVDLEPPRSAELDVEDDVAPPADETEATAQGFVDWPKEGRDAVARVLAAEAEAERIAKMFAGPQGTWASLTKRQQSELSKFRWRPGVDGLERDEKGNTVYQMPNGCTLVNFQFIGCPIGKKPPAYGDLFKDMRKYFDEQRLPRTDEGNGREPESMRPPTWSKPLP